MIKKLLSFFAMFEGMDHLVLSAISYWGFIEHHMVAFKYWNLWVTPIADTIFGFSSILTGLVLNRLLDRKNSEE